MKSRWSDREAQALVERYAARGISADLALRTYSSRLLGSDPQLVLHGGGNTSVKTALTDAFGNEVAAICVKGSGRDLATIEPEGHSALRLEPLFGLRHARLTDAELVNFFRQNLLDTTAPNPSIETLTHAAWTGMMADIEDATLRKSFELNFFAHQYVASAAVRIMRRQRCGGVLLFNVSKQAVNPGPGFGAYGLSKAALLALVRQYALEHGADGIRANAVNADRIRSGLLTDAFIAERATARGVSEREYMSGNLLHEEVLADDVAQAFVASAMLEKTTGNVITVDGGNVAAMLR